MAAVDLIGMSDDPALEFVDTTASLPDGGLLELISDGQAYLTWLGRTGQIDSADQKAVGEVFTSAQLDAVAAQARDLREWLRPVIAAWAAAPDRTLPEKVAQRLNTILEYDHRFVRIQDEADGIAVHQRRRWLAPEQLLIPPVEAAARLLADGDQHLVRKCEGCSMWFYDRTKAHRRRWCSMALCGNRAKARSHRERIAADRAEQI